MSLIVIGFYALPRIRACPKRALSGFQTIAIGFFLFYFSWWARKVAKEPSPAPLISLPGGFPWRGKTRLMIDSSWLMHEFKLFKCQMLFNLAAQTVSPFIHGKPPGRDAARWAKPSGHKLFRKFWKYFDDAELAANAASCGNGNTLSPVGCPLQCGPGPDGFRGERGQTVWADQDRDTCRMW